MSIIEGKLNVRVIDSGGRGHALAWKIAQSHLVARVVMTPGNAGWMQEYLSINLNSTTNQHLVEVSASHGDHLVVIGPEVPLANGLADAYRAAGIPCVGPGAAGAQVEASKLYTKLLCEAAGILSPRYRPAHSYTEAYNFLEDNEDLRVVKADWLAAGKGVKVADTELNARLFAHQLFEGRPKGPVLLEECLVGHEYSVIGLCENETVRFLPVAQDYKRAYDGDKGDNTGGMGTYSSSSLVTPEKLEKVRETVFLPALYALRDRGISYKGFLFAGMMAVGTSDYLLEFNCRPGDPETQAAMVRIDSDIVPYLWAVATGGLAELPELSVSDDASVCVVLAEDNYPMHRNDPTHIEGLDQVSRLKKEGIHIFHAGTSRIGSNVQSSGGRVLNVVVRAPTVELAREKAYGAIQPKGPVGFAHMRYRSDIGLGA